MTCTFLILLPAPGRLSPGSCRAGLSSIAITLLVKKRNSSGKAVIHYHDIGDYLKRERKLSLLKKYGSFLSESMPDLETLHTNEENDWINLRNPVFSTFIPLGDTHPEQPSQKT